MEPVTVFIVFMLGAIVGIFLGSSLATRKEKSPELELPVLGDGLKYEAMPSPKVLNTPDGSIVVLQVPGAISAENAKRLKEHWENSAVGTKCIVLSDGLSINCVLDPSKP